jgi:Fe2+ or Zn2+ uptake regulation protein
MTRQRRVVLDEVQQAHSHPTAGEVYELVRRRLPRISLATVYRSLEALAGQGLLRKLEMGGTQRRSTRTSGPTSTSAACCAGAWRTWRSSCRRRSPLPKRSAASR